MTTKKQTLSFYKKVIRILYLLNQYKVITRTELQKQIQPITTEQLKRLIFKMKELGFDVMHHKTINQNRKYEEEIYYLR